MIYIASDHGGYALKELLKLYFVKHKIEYMDLGANQIVKDDDYPDYAKLVAKKVSEDPGKNAGILLCRSGQGMAITANKFKSVRAAVIWNTKQAKAARNDDMTNVLALPSDYIAAPEAWRIVKTWLTTPYSKDKRHLRRVKKIAALEK
jgi:ribose 5-phosphate isomerase B